MKAQLAVINRILGALKIQLAMTPVNPVTGGPPCDGIKCRIFGTARTQIAVINRILGILKTQVTIVSWILGTAKDQAAVDNTILGAAKNQAVIGIAENCPAIPGLTLGATGAVDEGVPCLQCSDVDVVASVGCFSSRGDLLLFDDVDC